MRARGRTMNQALPALVPRLKFHLIVISKVRNLTIFNYHQNIDILVIINQCKTNSI